MATDAPTTLEVKQTDPVLSYSITGGTGLYIPHWIGAEPAGIMAAMQGNQLKIFVKPKATEADFQDGKYKLDVYDTTAGTPRHLPAPIEITAKKKS